MPFIRDKYLPFFKLVSPTWIMFESGQFQVGTTTEFAQMQNMSRVVSYSTDFPTKSLDSPFLLQIKKLI